MSALVIVADAVPPPLDWSHLTTMAFEWQPTVMLLAAAGLYLWGAGGSDAAPGGHWSAARTVAFFGGLVCTSIAVESVIGAYDDVLFYDHMIQHLVLIMIAAPLFAMGAPLELLQRASAGRLRRAVDAAMGSGVAAVIGHPLFGFVAYAAVIPITHLTGLYNFTLTHETAHDLEHLLFLVVGYLFWRPVVAIEPTRHRLSPALQLVYLALAVPIDTFTGLTLAMSAHEIFPYYQTFTRPWGPSIVTDLHVGGSIMWVGGDMLMFFAMIPVAVRWVRTEERRAITIDAQLDAEEAAEAEAASLSRAEPGTPS